MTTDHFMLGGEYLVLSGKPDLFLIGGVALSSLTEDVGELGRFDGEGIGFYLGGRGEMKVGGLLIGGRLFYSYVDIEGNNVGGLFALISIGI